MTTRSELGDQFIELLGTLMRGGYVLARRNELTGALEPIAPSAISDNEQNRLRIKPQQVDDDMEVSVADAYRFGVLQGSSYTAVRMKLARGRNMYPDITPKFRTRGAETLYRVGDLRRWQDEYNARSRVGRPRVSVERGARPEPDALFVLLEKIRGKDEEDV